MIFFNEVRLFNHLPVSASLEFGKYNSDTSLFQSVDIIYDTGSWLQLLLATAYFYFSGIRLFITQVIFDFR